MWWSRKCNYAYEWNEEDNSGFEIWIESRERNIEENTGWTEDVIEKLDNLIKTFIEKHDQEDCPLYQKSTTDQSIENNWL